MRDQADTKTKVERNEWAEIGLGFAGFAYLFNDILIFTMVAIGLCAYGLSESFMLNGKGKVVSIIGLCVCGLNVLLYLSLTEHLF